MWSPHSYVLCLDKVISPHIHVYQPCGGLTWFISFIACLRLTAVRLSPSPLCGPERYLLLLAAVKSFCRQSLSTEAKKSYLDRISLDFGLCARIFM